MARSLLRIAQDCAICSILMAVCAPGCQTVPPSGKEAALDQQPVQAVGPPSPNSAQNNPPGTLAAEPVPRQAGSQAVVSLLAYQQPNAPAPCAADLDDPFANQTELSMGQLVDEVLKRNPSLQAMTAAWQAAAERYPQVISLEDPMLMVAMGPGTFGDPTHDVAWMVEGSQKIPWGGKRELRGQQAQAEANAARWEVEDTALRLSESTKLAFLDYYLVRRDQALNSENLKASQEFRDSAQSKFQANLVTQQDVLQADVDLADLSRRQFELQRMDRVAVARINTLLHRAPDNPLPSPPNELSTRGQLPPIDHLQLLAAQQRPDLMALGARLSAEQAAIASAERDYYPDVTVLARYDGFWQHADRDLAPMVGVNLNVPLHNERRCAAVREAQFRASQGRAEYESKLDEIHGDVEAAYQQLVESTRTIELYRTTILPVIEQNYASARGNYNANKIDFLRLTDANRQQIMLREKYQETIADYHRRLTELERAVGGPIDAVSAEEISPPTSHPNP